MQQAENHVFSVFCAFFMFCLPSLASMQCLSFKGGGEKGYNSNAFFLWGYTFLVGALYKELFMLF